MYINIYAEQTIKDKITNPHLKTIPYCQYSI